MTKVTHVLKNINTKKLYTHTLDNTNTFKIQTSEK